MEVFGTRDRLWTCNGISMNIVRHNIFLETQLNPILHLCVELLFIPPGDEIAYAEATIDWLHSATPALRRSLRIRLRNDALECGGSLFLDALISPTVEVGTKFYFRRCFYSNFYLRMLPLNYFFSRVCFRLAELDLIILNTSEILVSSSK